MPRGGVRPGQGRPSRAEELKTATLAQSAIIAKFGTLEKGLEALLGSGEPVLVRFVFEHAMGKPTDNLQVAGEIAIKKIKFTDAAG